MEWMSKDISFPAAVAVEMGAGFIADILGVFLTIMAQS